MRSRGWSFYWATSHRTSGLCWGRARTRRSACTACGSRAELTELRGPDLRFSLDETRALLRARGIALSDEAVSLLQERTEGWPAGLRLAAISLAAHPDPERFVSEFSGSERTVAGYLLAEVLERQPPEVRDLLLRTSVLERVSGPLADTLTGGAGAEAILQRLEDQNAFVSALDAARTWFRCHHLFADLLRLELRRVAPGSIASLHRAAAAWHEQQGDVVEAIRHAQAAGDWAHAGRLLVDNYLALTMAGRGQTLHALLGMFPPDTQLNDCNIATAFAVDNIVHGLLEDSAAHLDTARRLAGSVPAERRRRIEAYLALIGLELARRHSDLPKAQEAMRGLEAAPLRQEYWVLALMNLGIVELWAGQYDAARQHLEDALNRTRRISQPFVEVGCLAHLAIAALLTGQPLPLALELSERALAIAEEHGWTSESMTTGAFAMAGTALARMGRFAEAERHLDRAEELLRAAADPGTESRASPRPRHAPFRPGPLRRGTCGVRASAGPGTDARKRARVHHRGAVSALSRYGYGWATQTRRSSRLPTWGPRSAPAPGRVSPSRPWSSKGTIPNRPSRRWLPFSTALRARWSSAGPASRHCCSTPRLEAASATGAQRSSRSRKLSSWPSPNGLILPFMLWPSRELLERHPRHHTAHATLISTVLDTLAGRAPQRGPAAPLRDELSEAELRVARYLPSNLSAPEIAGELFVSANTVRTHMRHIYAKLDAHSRSEAVARARELGLLAPGASGR